MILFIVRPPKQDVQKNVLVYEEDREQALRCAQRSLSRLDGDPSTWDVIPLTEPESKVFIDFVIKAEMKGTLPKGVAREQYPERT